MSLPTDQRPTTSAGRVDKARTATNRLDGGRRIPTATTNIYDGQSVRRQRQLGYSKASCAHRQSKFGAVSRWTPAYDDAVILGPTACFRQSLIRSDVAAQYTNRISRVITGVRTRRQWRAVIGDRTRVPIGKPRRSSSARRQLVNSQPVAAASARVDTPRPAHLGE